MTSIFVVVTTYGADTNGQDTKAMVPKTVISQAHTTKDDAEEEYNELLKIDTAPPGWYRTTSVTEQDLPSYVCRRKRDDCFIVSRRIQRIDL